jgi:endonuclease V-like protein UPF0215 family
MKEKEKTMITTFDLETSGYDFNSAFNSAIIRMLESARPNLNVTVDDSRFQEWTIETENGEKFNVQVTPTNEIPEDCLVGGLWMVENEAPTVEIDGTEYTIIRQW